MGSERGTVVPNGIEIRRLRKLQNITQERLATATGLERKTVSRIENGNPTLPGTLSLIAEVLGTPLQELIKGESCVTDVLSCPPGIAAHIETFDGFIDDRLRDFRGRDFVFREIDGFTGDPNVPSGYFLILGDPGIGKSAIISRLVNSRRLDVYHFNIAPEGRNTPRRFFANVCARLIRTFGLAYDELPEGFDGDGEFLARLLSEVSEKLEPDEKLVIAVDALDEVEVIDTRKGANPLYLPPSLPNGVYFVVSARPRYELGIQASFIREFEIDPKSEENEQDVRAYIAEQASHEGIRAWMRKQGLEEPEFVKVMVDKSEGNFMYLRHVLREMEAGGFLRGTVDDLPHGLRAYYRAHWQHMRDHDSAEFERLHQPVVCVLAAAQEPVATDQVVEWTGLPGTEVLRVLRQWWEYLHKEPSSGNPKRYRIYHKAFQDFLQEEVDPGLATYHGMIAQSGMDRIRDL